MLTYPLAEPASAVRSIEGTSSGLPRTFLVAIDFVFTGTATNTVVWLDDGTKPDDDTTFFVDYLGVESRSPLSDLKVGSVTRAHQLRPHNDPDDHRRDRRRVAPTRPGRTHSVSKTTPMRTCPVTNFTEKE